MGEMTRKLPIVIDGAEQADHCTEDARTYAQRLIVKLDGLDDSADERRFVEAVVQATGLDPADTILITDSADADSSEPLAERVLLPPTGDLEQLEIVRRMLTYSDDHRDGALFRHKPPTQHSTGSRWSWLRNRLTALW